MARVVPSEIVRLIDTWFPVANPANAGSPVDFSIGRKHAVNVAAILVLVDDLPSELMTLQAQEYTKYVAAVQAARHAVRRWEGGISHGLTSILGFEPMNPVVMIRRALAKCPDEAPSPDVSGLEFLDDEELRRNLRIDMSATERAVSHAEWKAATVLGGSVVEALLLWKMQGLGKKRAKEAATALLADEASQPRFIEPLTSRPPPDLARWNLHQLVLAAWKLESISDETAKQCDLLRNFRNLIHPGRTQRLKQVCDKSTAHAAVAAVEAVCRDLSV